MNMRHTAADPEGLESRVGARLAAVLALQAASLPNDISERLRVSREQALARARTLQPRAAAAGLVVGRSRGGAASLAAPSPWWVKLASGLPLLVLLVGLVLIDRWTQHEQVLAAAEIDAMLLADDLPPQAYADPGFGEFLKSPTP